MHVRLGLKHLKYFNDFFPIKSRGYSNFYVTTPIFYVNADPHIGHIYTAVIADASHRFQILLGANSVLSTGTDEHGTKIQQAAASHNMPLPAYCEQVSLKFKNTFDIYNVNYKNFIRTSEDKHKKSVLYFWENLISKGYIYSGSYSGWYCDADEAFLTENQIATLLKDGKETKVCSDSGRPVHWVEEKNYKFKLSLFQNDVYNWLKKDDSIHPEKFKKQLFTWINDGLMDNDISVSRPTSRVHWGIPVPGDESQTVYVWLDALVNYLTTSGYPDLQVWPPSVQVIGKDILKFHGIYWPAFLLANGLDLPKMLFVHSHWTVDGDKMSKSLGNVICPLEAAQRFTAEGLRYFLLREGTPHTDSNYSETKALRILNSELADTLGNLLNRCCAKSINKNQEFPEFSVECYEQYCKEAAAELILSVNMLQDEVKRHYLDFNFYRGISIIISTLHAANKFFELSRPWELRKNETSKDHLDCVLHLTMETLRICAITLQPIIPQLSSLLLDKLSIPTSSRNWCDLTPSWQSNSSKSSPLNSQKVVLYKRIYQ